MKLRFIFLLTVFIFITKTEFSLERFMNLKMMVVAGKL